MKTLAITVLAFGVVIMIHTAVPAQDDLAGDISAILKLRGEPYQKERKKLLDKKFSADVWESFAKSSSDWRAQIVARSLAVETKDARLIHLLLSQLPENGGGVKQESPRKLATYMRNDRTVVLCFGTKAFAPLAERLIFGEAMSRTMMDSIIETRDILCSRVLITIADSKTSTIAEANALWRLEKCLKGLPALNLKRQNSDDLENTIDSFVPEEWKPLEEDRDLPELKLSDNERKAVIDTIMAKLNSEQDMQVRAISAYLARYGGQSVVAKLELVVKKDDSDWVRAWCIDSLRAIGGKEATDALESIGKSEQSGEVKKVLNGEAKLLAPWNGVPKDSILKENK